MSMMCEKNPATWTRKGQFGIHLLKNKVTNCGNIILSLSTKKVARRNTDFNESIFHLMDRKDTVTLLTIVQTLLYLLLPVNKLVSYWIFIVNYNHLWIF
jgi:hypothetical protein